MPPLTVAQLARRTHRTQRELELVLGEMEAEGLVERVIGNRWTLTDAAVAIADALCQGFDFDGEHEYRRPQHRRESA